jgi:hypothetical protein
MLQKITICLCFYDKLSNSDYSLTFFLTVAKCMKARKVPCKTRIPTTQFHLFYG